MSKLTLDEKHRKLADCINSLKSHYLLSEMLLVAGRKLNIHPETEALIAKIYLADGIDWIEPKYNWRLKSEKFGRPYIGSDVDGEWMFVYGKYEKDTMTESEFKKLLEGTELPFEAFEGVDIDD